MSKIEISTQERVVRIDGQWCAEWRRGVQNVGIIVLQNEYIEKRSLEEMSISDAEALANAILAICKDAREAGLNDQFETGEPAQSEG